MSQDLRHLFSGLEARHFLRQHGFKASNTASKIGLEMIEGLSPESLAARSQSFLTHSTQVEEQIRFPLSDRVERSFKALVLDLRHQNPSLRARSIELYPEDTVSIVFFRTLGFEIEFNWKKAPARLEELNQDELTLMELLKNPLQNRNEILTFVRKRIYTCNYRSALWVLNALNPELGNQADEFYAKGLCHNYFGETRESQLCFEKTFEFGSDEMKANACYVLSMLYLRLHPPKYQNLEKAENYLQEGFDLLNALPPSEEIVFQRVFNRNGYALCLFRRGLILEAAQMLENGMAQLRRFETDRYNLHLSVLLYNALQCYRGLERYDQCEKVTKELLALDPLFPEYHLEHGKTLLQQGKNLEALASFQNAVALDPLIPEAHALVAYAYFIETKIPQAIQNYQAALALKPESTQFQEDLLYCQHLQNQTHFEDLQ